MNQQPIAPTPAKSSSLKWLLIILVIIIILGGGYLAWAKYGGSSGTSTTAATPTPTATVSSSISPNPSASSSVSSIKKAKDFYAWYLNLSKDGSQAKFASTNPYKLKSDFANYLTTSLISSLERLFNNPDTNYDPIVCAQDLPASIDYSSSGLDVIAKMNFTSAKNVTLKFTNGKISSIICP